MGYLGNTPAESFLSFEKQVFTIVNSQTTYTLSFSVTNENDIRLVINNVVQEPGSGKAYTASGTTLTLSAALTNGTDEMYCVFLGRARETVTVPDITRDNLNLISDASNPSLIAKGTSGVSEGYIQLNCAENSHGIKLKSPPHSAGQSYTLTFPQSITNNTFLKTDGSGNLSFASAASAGEANDPSFHAYNPQNGSIATSTNVVISNNTELFDSSSAYDTSTYRFTPQVAGYYFLYANIRYQSSTNAFDRINLVINKNGSAILGARNNNRDYSTASVSGIVQANGSSDYFDMQSYQNSGLTMGITDADEYTYFGGFLVKKT